MPTVRRCMRPNRKRISEEALKQGERVTVGRRRLRRQPLILPVVGAAHAADPSGSAVCGGSAAAATGSVFISAGASGGATAIVDGEAVAGKTGAAGVVGCGVPGDVATGGVASLTWWFASAARTVA